jgi:4,5-DOPA dioxygenase extradiol
MNGDSIMVAGQLCATCIPDANIPVLQLSIDYYKTAEYHYKLAGELASLRKKGVLIMGSGNMVHNLRRVDWQNMNTPNFGFDWAKEINETFKKKIEKSEHQSLIDYENLGTSAKLAIPTPDHYFPLIYSLGLQDKSDEVEFFNDKYVGGSLSMTSVKIFS